MYDQSQDGIKILYSLFIIISKNNVMARSIVMVCFNFCVSKKTQRELYNSAAT